MSSVGAGVPDRLAGLLGGRYTLAAPPLKIGRGAWSAAYGFDAIPTGGGRPLRLVARIGSHLDDFAKDALAGGFSGPALPVPAVLSVDEWAPGEYLAVSQRADGAFLESLDGAAWALLLDDLLTALDALHGRDPAADLRRAPDTCTGPGVRLRVDDDAVGLNRDYAEYLLSVGDDPPAGRLAGWRDRLRRGPIGDGDLRTGLEVLRRGVAAVRTEIQVGWVHSDLINRNVLVGQDGSGIRLRALFDWGCLFVGDRLYDLAWLEFWTPWTPGLLDIDLRSRAREHFARNGIDVPAFDERMRLCCLHIGLAHLAYNAFTGNVDNLRGTQRRLAEYL